MSLSLGSALGIAGATSLLSGITNYLTGQHYMEKQADMSRDLWEYQWDKAYSPQAQVRNNAAAGVNPAAQFGNHSILAGSPQMAMPSIPNTQFGVTGLSDLANYIAAGAQAKKTGVEIPNIEADTQGKIIDNQAQQFELDLKNRFGLSKAASELALAWKQVQLAQDSHDINVKEQALKDWSIAKEKALSECEETRRDILKKEFENKDIQIKLENEQRRASIGETQSRSAFNRASAENQTSQVEVNRENRRIQAALADIEEGSKDAKLQALLSKYRSEGQISDADFEEAQLRLSRLGDITDHRDNSWFAAVDNFTEWLKSKVKIFGK